MNKLTSYIFGQLFFTVLSLVLALSSLVWLIQTLRYIDLIANKGVPIFSFLKMVAYLFPNILVIIVPVSLLIGILFIYNKLISDHELVVMQGAGTSPWGLARPALLLSLILTLFLYFITVYFLPYSFRKHRDMVLLLRQESLSSLISEGQFNTLKNYTVYAHHQGKLGHFSGILLYDITQPGKAVFFTAQHGRLIHNDEGGALLLVQGSRQEQDLRTGKPSVLYFDRYLISSPEKASKNKEEGRFLRAYERNMTDLIKPPEQLDTMMQREFISAFHQRLMSPLYALVFGLLGASVMVLGYFNRKGRGRKIFMACILAALIEGVGMISLHTLHYSSYSLILCYGVLILPILVCLFLLSPWQRMKDLLTRAERKS